MGCLSKGLLKAKSRLIYYSADPPGMNDFLGNRPVLSSSTFQNVVEKRWRDLGRAKRHQMRIPFQGWLNLLLWEKHPEMSMEIVPKSHDGHHGQIEAGTRGLEAPEDGKDDPAAGPAEALRLSRG